MSDLGLKFSQSVRKRCMNSCAKNGGAPRRRFSAIGEKPEGGGGVQTPPPARRGLMFAMICVNISAFNYKVVGLRVLVISLKKKVLLHLFFWIAILLYIILSIGCPGVPAGGRRVEPAGRSRMTTCVYLFSSTPRQRSVSAGPGGRLPGRRAGRLPRSMTRVATLSLQWPHEGRSRLLRTVRVVSLSLKVPWTVSLGGTGGIVL